MESIIKYLTAKYSPVGIIVYGSFSNGTNNSHSDFDALLIVSDGAAIHDTETVNGVELDVFVYPRTVFDGEFDASEYVQVWDGKILLDSDGTAALLKKTVCDYIRDLPKKTDSAIRESIVWCEKMLHRAARGDTEGCFRWHWLLVDSLEIYCDICGMHYFGPKKSLSSMKDRDPQSAELYGEALAALDYTALQRWIGRLRTLYESEKIKI